MREFKRILEQRELDELLKEINLNDDSFIREVYFLSQTYLKKDSIIAHAAPGDLVMIVGMPGSNPEMLELMAKDVTLANFNSKHELHPSGKISKNQFTLNWLENSVPSIEGRELYFRLSEKIRQGNYVKYGKLSPNEYLYIDIDD